MNLTKLIEESFKSLPCVEQQERLHNLAPLMESPDSISVNNYLFTSRPTGG